MAKKYYVVWEGHQTGVFTSWAECKRAVNNFPNAKYKSFPTEEMAQKAYAGNYETYKGKKIEEPALSSGALKLIGKPILPSIAVDAACSGNPGTMHYRGVDLSTGEIIFSQGPFMQATNNIGEFLAIVHALALMEQTGEQRTIYSDSKIAISWVKQKKCKTKLPASQANKKVFSLIERAEKWLHTHTYTAPILKWETKIWGEIPADYGNKQR